MVAVVAVVAAAAAAVATVGGRQWAAVYVSDRV